jgi:hypothetical protein
VPGIAARERTRPIASPLDLAAPDAAIGHDSQPIQSTATQQTVATPTIAAKLDPGPATNGLTPPDETPPRTASDPLPAEPATRRGRRFVLPRNDEDKGRTERAIEAFLGEPAPSGSTSTHRPRRRARRRGAPGEAGGPLVLVAALGGFEQLRQTVGREGAIRFAEAYGEALRATMRSGDHLTDLGQGRLRLVVHADEEGAQALMDRARGVCEPWLRLAPVPLALRVRPMPDPRSGNGHRPGGYPDRRRPEGHLVDGSPTGGGSAHPTSTRPNEADARGFAAG